MNNLYRIIKELKNKKPAAAVPEKQAAEVHPFMTAKDKKKRQLFPGLCLPDDDAARTMLEAELAAKAKEDQEKEADKQVVDDAMALFESMAAAVVEPPKT
jgi:hypothetical protein